MNMEVDEYGTGTYFGDYEIFNNTAVKYSAVAVTLSDILTVTW